jgi:hypothetical protein
MGEHVEPGARSFGSPPLNYEFFRNLLEKIGEFVLSSESPSARTERIRGELIAQFGGKSKAGSMAEGALDIVRWSTNLKERQKALRWFLILKGALGRPLNTFKWGSEAMTDRKLSDLVGIYLDL